MISPADGAHAPEAVATADRPVGTSRRTAALRVAVQVVRLLLAGCLLYQILAALWLASMDSDLRTLVADLRADRVTTLEIGEIPVADWLRFSGGEHGTMIRWRTDGGDWRVMALDEAPFPTRDLLPPGQDPYGAPVPRGGQKVAGMLSGSGENQTVVYAIAAAYAPHRDTVRLRSTEDNPWQWSVDMGDSAVTMVMLLALVAGPKPRLATKWAWLWLYFSPLWLGVFTALAVEKPWSGRDAIRENRLNGWQGFLIALVAGAIAIPLASVLLPR